MADQLILAGEFEQQVQEAFVLRLLQRTAARLLAREASPLTVREGAVLSLVADGYTTYAIANELGIADNTVKNHLRNINRKLGVNSRSHAVAVASRADWLT